jgi:hypothetical protein
MTAIKPIDDSLFVQMWEAGATSVAIGAAVGLGRSAIYPRAALLGLEPRAPRSARPWAMASKVGPKVRAVKPAAKPAAAPVYQPGLSDAIQRAGGSVERLGKVATSYRVPYREVLQMAGVQA